MSKAVKEWFNQAEYDMKTAEALFESKRKTIIYVEKGKDVLKWLKAQL